MQETDNTLYSSLDASFSCIDWSYTVGMIEYGAHPTFLWVLWRNDYICQKTSIALDSQLRHIKSNLKTCSPRSAVTWRLSSFLLSHFWFVFVQSSVETRLHLRTNHGGFCWAFWGRGSFPPLSPGKNGKNKIKWLRGSGTCSMAAVGLALTN